MKVEELSRRILCNITAQEENNQGKTGLISSIINNKNRLIVDKFHVKLAIFLSNLSDDLMNLFIGVSKYYNHLLDQVQVTDEGDEQG